MSKTLFALSGVAACFATTSFAGALENTAPESNSMMAAPATWSGGIELGYGLSARTSTQQISSIADSPYGGFTIAGYFSTKIGQMDLIIDGRFTEYDLKGETYRQLTGPNGSGVLGVHLGKDIGDTFVGAFAAYTLFDGYDSSDYMSGYLLGVEASRTMGNGTGFAQLGYGSLIGSYENKFEGVLGRVGYGFDVSEKIGLVLDAEAGYAFDCFVDCPDQPGMYASAGIDAEYRMTDTVSVYAEYEYLHIYDYNDPDTGTESNIMVGVRMAFGGGEGNLLSTPMGAIKAAGWMDPLD